MLKKHRGSICNIIHSGYVQQEIRTQKYNNIPKNYTTISALSKFDTIMSILTSDKSGRLARAIAQINPESVLHI
jgi:hypothetical protein